PIEAVYVSQPRRCARLSPSSDAENDRGYVLSVDVSTETLLWLRTAPETLREVRFVGCALDADHRRGPDIQRLEGARVCTTCFVKALADRQDTAMTACHGRSLRMRFRRRPVVCHKSGIGLSRVEYGPAFPR